MRLPWVKRQGCRVGVWVLLWRGSASSFNRLAMHPVFHTFLCSTIVVLCLFSSTQATSLSDTVQVQTGLLAGNTLAGSGVKTYLGIPFAAPPTGNLRWRPPQPAASWDGVRAAHDFADSCVQELTRSRPPWTEPFMVQGDASEDCLYLNIWTAAPDTEAKHPVLVYIHGGGFNEGSGSVATYDGERLAQKGLIIVTINYRLNVFGFLAHPELTAASEHNASGNYGLLDQVAALQWVQDNIAAFGGDPGRVTVAGQSAGAMSVQLLTVSPLAKGLFHRAIIQSGPGGLAAFGVISTKGLGAAREVAEQAGVAFAEQRGLASLEAMRAASVETLTVNMGGGMPFRPIVDGWFLTKGVDAAYAAGRQHDVPLLNGMNADEGSFFPGYGKPTPEAFRKQVGERYGDHAEAFLKLYPADTAEETGRSQKTSMQDIALVALKRIMAEWTAGATAPAYMYYFDRAIPWPQRPEFGAFHTGEVPYLFNTFHKLDRPWEPADYALAETVNAYWINFAATGNPNGEGLPEWPAYQPDDPQFIRLGIPVEAQSRPDPARTAFFETYLGQQP